MTVRFVTIAILLVLGGRSFAQKEGMQFLRESAIDRVKHGLTTLKEINKVTFIEAMR